ncbi:GtrA family protein [Pseudoduganella violaceinigra]|uniref:GtrA family protein n=1 Tax=Pseudoduganella violaceinigra TaxID=246602 RepID=UPI0003F7F652|nr:GtrA family protein [Pseudoduganella violaceinigra]
MKSTQAFAFLLVGALAALVHMAAVYLMVEHAACLPQQANFGGFAVAFLVSYLGQRRFTFGGTVLWRHSMWRWGVVSLLGFFLNQALFTLALLRLPALPYLLSLGMVTLFVAGVTFVLGKAWAFAELRR